MANDDIYANSVTTNTVHAQTVQAASFGGGGGGAVITASVVIIGGYSIEAGDKGLYVTTPDGIRTKMELIDFRQTPVPETATLLLSSGSQVAPAAAISAKGGGGGAGSGNSHGGGGVSGSSVNSPGAPVSSSPAAKIATVPDGTGFQTASAEAVSKLTPPLQADSNFIPALNNMAKQINMPADNMLAAMQMFTGLNPAAVNRLSGSVGLMQLQPGIIENLGYSPNQLTGMLPSAQLTGPIKAYMSQLSLPAIPTTADFYMSSFYPHAMGKLDSFVLGNDIGTAPELVAAQNPVFKNDKGLVTVGSIKQYIANR